MPTVPFKFTQLESKVLIDSLNILSSIPANKFHKEFIMNQETQVYRNEAEKAIQEFADSNEGNESEQSSASKGKSMMVTYTLKATVVRTINMEEFTHADDLDDAAAQQLAEYQDNIEQLVAEAEENGTIEVDAVKLTVR